MTVIWTVRERSRHRALAATRSPLKRNEFVARFSEHDVDPVVAGFVWDEMQPYYFAPLTPDPSDRPIGDLRVDPEDLSDMIMAFEKSFDRNSVSKWIGPNDPTLVEFAAALTDSTEPR